MVQDTVIPVPVLGIEFMGGPIVSILSSKQSSINNFVFTLMGSIFCKFYLH